MAQEITPNNFSIEEINGMINTIIYIIENDRNTEVLSCSIESMINLIPHSRTISDKFVWIFLKFLFYFSLIFL